MTYLDLKIFRGIITITLTILKDNFFYDDDCLRRFIKKFYEVIEFEYLKFSNTIDDEIRDYLENDWAGRKDFTSYFVSYHVSNILVEFLFFSEQELKLFENILPKYIGANNDKNVEQGNERATN